MTAWLKLVPAWAWLVGAWALSLVLVGGVQQLRVAGAQVVAAGAVTALASYRTEVSERDRRATLAALEETKRRMTAAAKVQKDAEQQIEVARADAAAAGSALERLKLRLEAVEQRSRAAGNTITAQLSQATGAEARMLADLLGRIGETAGLYADIADDRGIRGASCERHYDSLGGG
ncbi:DUF2514 family protein [Pseudomonas sp. NPDC079086]|uniref:DUF2514 family protein n=1 Tax=unclassified Pseudomonas TaxID=196821 RepID=UPI0037C573FA